MKPYHLLRITLLSATMVAFLPAVAQEDQSNEFQKITARALTPMEITDWELPEDLMPSGGLLTIGVGERIHLQALVPEGTVVNGVTWSVLEQPAGASAGFMESPLPPEMPIYSPGNAAVSFVADRKMMIPDVIGVYDIQAVVSTPEGDITLQEMITAAEYVGVGTIVKEEAEYPECALCHGDMEEGWSPTAHAMVFEEGINGHISHFTSEESLRSTTMGYNPHASNKGFDDVADEVGWTFPETLEGGNWDELPDALKAASNVQCENCHGPGSLHHGIEETISVTMDAGDCGQCHDSSVFHTPASEWQVSGHAVATRYPTGEGRESCVRCHSGIGFVETVKGQEITTGYEAITCAACHNPHEPENPALLRTMDDVVLQNNVVIEDGGMGKLCMECHQSRREAETYTLEYHRHYGPHSSNQGDMLAGTNAIEYGRSFTAQPHLVSPDESCVTCHMQSTQPFTPVHLNAGGHTFKMVWDADTPEIHGDDVELVGACQDCHGPIDRFNIAVGDLDNDFLTEGFQDEITELMTQLGNLLPPEGPEVEVTEEFTVQQLRAAYNYLFVEDDGSHGVHNPAYAAGILKAAIADLTSPVNTPLGGEQLQVPGRWYASDTIGFYVPAENNSNWAYSYYLAWVWVAPSSSPTSSVYLWNQKMQSWLVTNEMFFPWVYQFGEHGWLYTVLDDDSGTLHFITAGGDVVNY